MLHGKSPGRVNVLRVNTLREVGEQQPRSGGLQRSHITLKLVREVEAKDAGLKQRGLRLQEKIDQHDKALAACCCDPTAAKDEIEALRGLVEDHGERSPAPPTHTRSLDGCDAQGRGLKGMNANYLQDFKSLQHESAAQQLAPVQGANDPEEIY